MTTRAQARLSRLDWVRAGQDLLREGGGGGLKLATLTKRLGVTTGSFYHHFEDFGAYLDDVCDSYSERDLQAAFASVASAEPVARLQMLFAITVESDTPRLDRAMRVWAASNERAAAAVRRVDHQFMAFLQTAFEDLGFDGDEARLRALIAFSTSAAMVYPPWPRSPDDARRTIELLTRPV